jgi:hypothetical protein
MRSRMQSDDDRFWWQGGEDDGLLEFSEERMDADLRRKPTEDEDDRYEGDE